MTASEKNGLIKVFISYHQQDDLLRKELEKHLSALRLDSLITTWYRGDVSPGIEWAKEAYSQLNNAGIILLLVSPDFMASAYISSQEMFHAMERHIADQARVIPIILRPVDWMGTPFDKLQVLPTQAKAITSWNNQDEAFLDVILGIRKAIKDLSTKSSSSYQFPLWNIPFPRNPFFTGREEIFTKLREAFTKNNVARHVYLQAISGLGGIGKTQTALEYAYRYRDDYQTILWVKSDTHEELIADFVAIAELLNLPERTAQDQNLTVNAVKRWLDKHTGWLLIFDNADDLSIIRNYLPTGDAGHVLLTTRAQVVSSLGHKVEIEKIEPDDGALFLLRRADIIPQNAILNNISPDNYRKAMEIVQEMGGLPLALDQAGAYIEETRCSLSNYLTLYYTQRARLLKRRGGLMPQHPEPVATTWALSFEKVERASPAAAALLRLCAFLAPDSIPEEIVTEGAPDLGPVLQPVAADPFELNLAIGELLRFSLVRRDSNTQTLTIHRLVQAVLRDGMDENVRRQWTERAVKAIHGTFPDANFKTWSHCQRLLPHAQACITFVQSGDTGFRELADLLNKIGWYLCDRVQYPEAESFFVRALVIYKHLVGDEHPDIATAIRNLALLYNNQGKYSHALGLYQQALKIYEKTLGTEHIEVATTLNNLAALYDTQDQYDEAEQFYQQALAIYERVKTPEDPEVADTLNNLAVLYSNQGRYDQASDYFQRSLAIYKKTFGDEHPHIALVLDNLARLYIFQGIYEQGELFHQQALSMREKTLGTEHLEVAHSLNNLAVLYVVQNEYNKAMQLYPRALAISEKSLGSEHPDVATILENQAHLLRITDQLPEAARLEIRARAIRAKHMQEVEQGISLWAFSPREEIG